MSKKKKIRGYIQIFFFALIAIIAVNHTLAESGKGIGFLSSASLHALCPFGGVVQFINMLQQGLSLKKFMSLHLY